MVRFAIAAALLACIAWAGVVGYEAWTGWPHMSLDLSHGDEGTQNAFRQAEMIHLVSHAVVGLGPLAVLSLLLALRRRRAYPAGRRM